MSERVRNLVALSATHRTAGLDERAAFTVPAGGAEAFYAAAREAGLAEAVLLATCNRLEAYGVGDEAAALHVRSALIKATGAAPAVLDQHLRPVPQASEAHVVLKLLRALRASGRAQHVKVVHAGEAGVWVRLAGMRQQPGSRGALPRPQL